MTRKSPLLFRILTSFIHKGELRLYIGAIEEDTRPFTAKGKEEGQLVTLCLSDKRTLASLVINPELGFPEAYMSGRLTLHNTTLDSLLIFLFENKSCFEKTLLAKILGKIKQARAIVTRAIGRSAARRNVAHHYDLTDALYALFLDERRQYSCGYFTSEEDSLSTAQIQKIARIAAKLQIKDGAKILDIGCGWGELAYALTNLEPEVRCKGITLSKNQLSYAQNDVATRSKGHAFFAYQDYRDERERYDNIVSVGMLEHVGAKSFFTYFKAVLQCLKDDGTALIHTIGKRRQTHVPSAFINKYIFPGGYIPTLGELGAALSQTDLHITDVECWHNHYAHTLSCWRTRCEAKKEALIALYDERFYRMWLFYLAACEYYFRLDEGVVYQIQLKKTREAKPSTRDYIKEQEQKYRKLLWQQTSLFGSKQS